MAAPNYEQIQSFSEVKKQLQSAAADEFTSYVHAGMTIDEVMAIASELAVKYSMLGCELGAQWYDLCAELAGINASPAEYETATADVMASRAQSYMLAHGDLDAATVFAAFLQDVVSRSIRETGSDNLHRDYERGIAGGRWTRVPVGKTCAWCLMLASQGAWYLSEKTALLAGHGGKFHEHCDCVAVYHASPESIAGYTALQRYKHIYYDADNARLANSNGTKPYDEELAKRIADAKAEHDARYKDGAAEDEWEWFNETLIVMRWQNPDLK